MSIQFGWKDYINMYRRRGIRLPYKYFIENHVFDLCRGTDTHTWLPKDKFEMQHSNLDHGILYMCSWSSVVIKSFHFIQRYLQDGIHEYTFVDVGSGKGKVLIIWKELLREYNIEVNLIGIDYYDYLSEIATRNFQRLFNENPNIIIADIIDVDLDGYGSNFCFYLYNPFDGILMERFLDKITNKNAVIIYNNPVHKDMVIEHGFSVLQENKHWHSNGEYVIFERRTTTSSQ